MLDYSVLNTEHHFLLFPHMAVYTHVCMAVYTHVCMAVYTHVCIYICCVSVVLQGGVFSPPSAEPADDGTSDLDFGALRRSSPQVCNNHLQHCMYNGSVLMGNTAKVRLDNWYVLTTHKYVLSTTSTCHEVISMQ